jgi:hypothetical protein
MKAYSVLLVILSLSASLFAQKDPSADDARALVAASKVEKNTYINQHAGFLLHLPSAACKPEVNHSFDLEHSSVLFACAHDTYTINMMVDRWSRYPQMTDIAQYVRGLHRLGEQDPNDRSRRDPNAQTIEPETPRKWAGLDFEEIIMKLGDSGSQHYIGVTCTHLKDYVLCFRGEARTLEMVQDLLKLERKLEITP